MNSNMELNLPVHLQVYLNVRQSAPRAFRFWKTEQ